MPHMYANHIANLVCMQAGWVATRDLCRLLKLAMDSQVGSQEDPEDPERITQPPMDDPSLKVKRQTSARSHARDQRDLMPELQRDVMPMIIEISRSHPPQARNRHLKQVPVYTATLQDIMSKHKDLVQLRFSIMCISRVSHASPRP